jgi:acyl-homoserine-lactone acylase
MKPATIASVVLIAVIFLATACRASAPPTQPSVVDQTAVWRQRAARVVIVRDDWGIAHISAATDADAVFGLMYAQAEDDFARIENNYLNALGRLAEAEGEAEIYRDLRMKLFIDPVELRAQYHSAPAWLQALMQAWADGLNYYLSRHPRVTPRVLQQFEPWMALSFSEGSIGGDIERVSIAQLQAFYGGQPSATAQVRDGVPPLEPTGSNGFAVAPSRTASGKALLLINPHTSFFFRAEAQITSGEGLNVYGALTWGQFFVYQGFNDRAGWMHTSSGVDNIDEYLETIVKTERGWFSKDGEQQQPVLVRTITVPYRTETGMAHRDFTVYRTHHGPVVRQQDGKWVAVALMQSPVQALIQSFTRTKARHYGDFRRVMELHANSSNNTVFADADGTIAYFHSNFVPRRDPSLDWSKPVDGSAPATRWRGIHSLDESPNVVNPPNGWIQNTNNWPYSAAGANSPKAKDYPAYFDTFGENPRGVHAMRVLEASRSFTLDSLVSAAFDPALTEFEVQIPALIAAWEEAPASSPVKARTAEAIALLRTWDLRWAANSVPTTLAVFWGETLWTQMADRAAAERVSVYEAMRSRASAAQRLEALAAVQDKLDADFGTWKTAWGEINRFQRISADLLQPFRDDAPSIPVPFTSARWGSLASFGARSYDGSKRIYGSSGNSFVAVVEFGAKIRARAVTAGGVSGDVHSKHFNDQATRYASGDLREVYFYPEQLERHTERKYHPGQ